MKKTDLKLTNLDKTFWPKEGYTKGDIVAYYERIAPYILPYLSDRPESLNRHPNGIRGKNFYQKNVEREHLPSFVKTVAIYSETNQKDLHWVVCNNKETLLWLANFGCIELNPWASRTRRLNKPDYLTIDLDPGKASFEEVIEVAKVAKEVLDLSCQKSYVKTSGKTGLHIMVPLGARYEYDVVRNFCQLLLQLVHERLPEKTTLEHSIKKRGKKVYLDYLRNAWGQTVSAPYCVRPYPGATVSTPLEWKEVKKGLRPSKFTIKTIHARLKRKGDLWKDLQTERVDLKKAVACLKDELAKRAL